MAIVRGKSTQFIVNLPTTKAKELQKLAAKMGLGEPAFVSVALVLGAQALERQFAPERFMPQTLIEALAQAGIQIAQDDKKARE